MHKPPIISHPHFASSQSKMHQRWWWIGYSREILGKATFQATHKLLTCHRKTHRRSQRHLSEIMHVYDCLCHCQICGFHVPNWSKLSPWPNDPATFSPRKKVGDGLRVTWGQVTLLTRVRFCPWRTRITSEKWHMSNVPLLIPAISMSSEILEFTSGIGYQHSVWGSRNNLIPQPS